MGEVIDRKRFIQGLILISLCTSFGFSSILALLNSTTSLLEVRMGSIGLTVSNVLQMTTAAILLPFLNKIAGVKKILTISFGLAVIFPLGFFYPRWYTFIPACVVMGMTLITLMCNVYSYGVCLVYLYHKFDSNKNLNVLMVVMTGVVNGSIGGGFLWGNILQYGIFGTSDLNETTYNKTEMVCGPHYCNEDISYLVTGEQPSKVQYYLLIGIYTGFSIFAWVLSLYLHDLTESTIPPVKKKLQAFCGTIRETLHFLVDPRGYLLILITLFIGIEEAFIVTFYTYAFIDCTLGVKYVSYIMFVFGVLQILSSFSQWFLVKIFGRIIVISGAAFVFITCFAILLKIEPKNNTEAVMLYMFIAAAFAFADSAMIANVFSVYGLVFEENVDGSFAVCNVWWSLGQLLANSTGLLFCISVKLYLLMGIASVSLILYFYLEFLLRSGRLSKRR